MTGDAGGAMTWWWDNYLEPLNLWPVFIGISKFVAPIDFAHKEFRPLSLEAPGLTVLSMQDAHSGETIFWLHDPDSNWKSDAAGHVPRVWSDVTISVPANQAMEVEVWDTRTGVVVRRSSIDPVNGSVNVTLPKFERDLAVRMFAAKTNPPELSH